MLLFYLIEAFLNWININVSMFTFNINSLASLPTRQQLETKDKELQPKKDIKHHINLYFFGLSSYQYY